MITVLTTFSHPSLGAVRGTLVDGEPMLCARELAHLLGCPQVEEAEKALRKFYHTKDVVVPINVTEYGNPQTENLLLIDKAAVFRMIEATANRAWQMYMVWFQDFVFPCLEKMRGIPGDPAYAAAFYWTCHDPEPSKPHDPQFDALFEKLV